MGWPRSLLLALPIIALFEVTVRVYLAATPPPTSDIESAASSVRQGYREGDLVVVSPSWFATARQALGNRVLPLEDQARADEDLYERLWVIAFGSHNTEAARRGELEERRGFGAVTVERYRLTPTADLVFDFVEEFERARVSADQDTSCHRQRGRWRCGRRGRNEWIGTETISDMNHRPRRCIWAHPLPDQRQLVIRFDDVARGQRIVGHHATDYVVGRHEGPEPTNFSVEVDGERILSLEHHDRDSWRRFEIEVPEGDGTADVSFIVDAPRFEDRHFCFQAQMRNPR